jgi:hypothetical protein
MMQSLLYVAVTIVLHKTNKYSAPLISAYLFDWKGGSIPIQNSVPQKKATNHPPNPSSPQCPSFINETSQTVSLQ